MPRLAPAVLALLIRALAAAEPDDVDAVRARPSGPDPAAADRRPHRCRDRRRPAGLGRGSRSLYAWLDGMRVHAARRSRSGARWIPARDTLLDVDRESDLGRIRP